MREVVYTGRVRPRLSRLSRAMLALAFLGAAAAALSTARDMRGGEGRA